MRQGRLLGLSTALLAVVVAGAQEVPRGKWFIEGFTGKSLVPFLGSEDPRSARGIGIGYISHVPRWLTSDPDRSELWQQIYYHRSTSPGFRGRLRNGTDSWGILTTVRYWAPVGRTTSVYFEIGAGLNLSDMRTEDLSSRLTSTPAVGLGFAFRTGRTEFMIGARLLHMSNAGLEGTNQGQNQLFLVVGIRF